VVQRGRETPRQARQIGTRMLSGAVQHEADGVDQVAGEQAVQRVDDPGLVRVAAHEHIAAAADAARVERHEQQQIHRGQRRSAQRRQAAAAVAGGADVPSGGVELAEWVDLARPAELPLCWRNSRRDCSSVRLGLRCSRLDSGRAARGPCASPLAVVAAGSVAAGLAAAAAACERRDPAAGAEALAPAGYSRAI
jgi:hypothetical protein